MKPADKPKKVTPAPGKPRPVKPDSTSSVRFSAIIFNVVGAIVAVVFLTMFFQHNEPTSAEDVHINSGYDWLLNTMLKNNLETIDKNPDKTLQQKYLLKWGTAEIIYVDSIRKLTPETAIVMLPPKSVIQSVGFKSVVDLPWITYFLYPRQVVYGDSIHDPLFAKATYVVSLNGWMTDRVTYPIEHPQPFMVLPIHK
jgi:hypothetical protein